MSEQYGYENMLDAGPPFKPSDDSLNLLAKHMTSTSEPTPAGYTYLGQFINHDINLARSKKTKKPSDPFGDPIPLNDVENFRSPFLNLETLYGFDYDVEGIEFKRSDLLDGYLFKLGDTTPPLTTAGPFLGKDLPRIGDDGSAEERGKPIIVDPRNDENVAIAQTHLAFMRFHNEVVKRGLKDDEPTPFEAARRLVIQHYQWIILNDYLPRILKASVLKDVRENGNQFYSPDADAPRLPLEFALGAFRMGHSTIRSSYNWNKLFNDDPGHNPATIVDLRALTKRGGSLTANKLPGQWAINWNWFFKMGGYEQGQKLNLAGSIDTQLAPRLGGMPLERSIPAIDLYRCRAHEMPTGQDVAGAMLGSKDRVLHPEQIAALLPQSLKTTFSSETPLWFYLLAEAELEEKGRTLGEVGSRIVAETLVKLISLTKPSILGTDFKPAREVVSTWKGEFRMADLFKFISGNSPAELDPLGSIKM